MSRTVSKLFGGGGGGDSAPAQAAAAVADPAVEAKKKADEAAALVPGAARTATKFGGVGGAAPGTNQFASLVRKTLLGQ